MLLKMNQATEAIYKINEKMASIEDLEDLYTLILKELINIIDGASKGSVLIYNTENETMEYKAAIGYDFKKLKEISFYVEELYEYQINKLEKSSIIKNPQQYGKEHIGFNKHHFLKEIGALDIKCVISLPLYVDHHFFGIINIDSTLSPHAFSNKDLNIAHCIKNQLEQSIKTILLINTLKEYAHYDYLTGIMNRRYFLKKFKEMDVHFKYVLALIDLNDFKYINDTKGHLEGDRILKRFSKTVKDHIREEDLFARIGGDEFIILFKNTSKKIANSRIQEIQKKLEGIIQFGVGLEEINLGKKPTFEEILKIVDAKMYTDKINKKSD